MILQEKYNDYQIILASNSPRRKQFLKDLAKAQKEYQTAQRKGDVPDPASCEFENKALSTTVGSVM